jgi:hypothetical protein
MAYKLDLMDLQQILSLRTDGYSNCRANVFDFARVDSGLPTAEMS